MKKFVITVAALLTVTGLYAADDVKTIDLDLDARHREGKIKAGVSLGYPTGITAGYRFTDLFELNGTLATDYDSLVLDVSGLFTLVKFKVEGEIFPFSLGPALYFDSHDHHHDFHDDKNHTHTDLLCIARFEYDFEEIPLNLFVEGGAGISMYEHFGPAGSFAIGARFIF